MGKKSALIIGHPGHELRAFKFLKDLKPDVYIITDGSGQNNDSRLHQSIKLIESLGATFKNSFSPFTDKELYNIILSGDLDKIKKAKNQLLFSVKESNYDEIYGDALEGFNPTHDICRYMINGIVDELQNINPSKSIQNYDFVLDKAPDVLSQKESPNTLSLELNELELNMKIKAGLNYPELKSEIEMAIERFGISSFAWEFYGQITDLKQIINWETDYPYYEEVGRKRVASGAYKNCIEFEKHIKPIAEICLMHNN
ncbi:hypothetical protein [Flavobacterium fluviatile]|uniref:hypothetical protein n=1 Tax=Flavobacterium fluviatile TaxID=1862387 RepID=UPI0013D75194|nr:hypothetical protein [Flavobacterium fluviatile]